MYTRRAALFRALVQRATGVRNHGRGEKAASLQIWGILSILRVWCRVYFLKRAE